MVIENAQNFYGIYYEGGYVNEKVSYWLYVWCF